MYFIKVLISILVCGLVCGAIAIYFGYRIPKKKAFTAPHGYMCICDEESAT